MTKYLTSEERMAARLEQNRQWRKRNIEAVREGQRSYTRKNKEERKEYNKAWRSSNREYIRERAQERYRELRLWFSDLKKQMGCKECGITDVRLLEFHHIDPDSKLFTIGNGTRGKAILEEEIKKCELLCANCHKIKQWEYRLKEGKLANY